MFAKQELQHSQVSTVSLVVSRARTSHTLEKGPVFPVNDPVFGSSSRGSYAKWNPASLSWRTSQLSLFGGLTLYSERWPISGMMLDGSAYALPPLALPTVENASSLWPTPTAGHQNDGESLETWEARREVLKARGINGNGCGTPLGVAVRLWPTASATDHEGSSKIGQRRGQLSEAILWPTPTREDGEGGAGHPKKKQGSPNLRTMVAAWPTPCAGDAKATRNSTANRSPTAKAAHPGNTLHDAAAPNMEKLNPEWVGMLMGFPVGWTDIGGPLPREKRNTNTSRRARSRKPTTDQQGSRRTVTP